MIGKGLCDVESTPCRYWDRRTRNMRYTHYEVSNYARPGFECAHNRVYWRNQPYHAFGMAAASYVGGVRFTRPKGIGSYTKWYVVEPLVEPLYLWRIRFSPQMRLQLSTTIKKKSMKKIQAGILRVTLSSVATRADFPLLRAYFVQESPAWPKLADFLNG
eukprot:6385266-Pyramimonas_sp.AAC.1